MVDIYSVMEVFTPNDVPKLTYVYRREHDYESQLRAAIRTPGQIVSLSGPSKSGKTALIKTVVSADNLIQVSGASISSADNLWSRVLGWMDTGVESTTKTGTTIGLEVGTKAAGSVGIPLVAKGTAEGTLKGIGARTSEESVKLVHHSLDKVVREIAGSDFVVFIDDFHYMEASVREAVARQIKEIAEKGVKVLTASVPHRSDDVVRSNPELRGRVRAIDFNYWSGPEVSEIHELGFSALGMQIPSSVTDDLAKQCFGSPQLMQSMCLQLCFQLGVEKTNSPAVSFEVTPEIHKTLLQHTSTTTDFSSALDAMHPGPKLRGQERKHFQLADGTVGDVYRCVLLAIARDPPSLSIRYDEILDRVKAVCVGAFPVGSSVSQALVQICGIAENSAGTRFIEWDEEILDISDPYFLFYLRCSPQLARLKSPGVQ